MRALAANQYSFTLIGFCNRSTRTRTQRGSTTPRLHDAWFVGILLATSHHTALTSIARRVTESHKYADTTR